MISMYYSINSHLHIISDWRRKSPPTQTPIENIYNWFILILKITHRFWQGSTDRSDLVRFWFIDQELFRGHKMLENRSEKDSLEFPFDRKCILERILRILRIEHYSAKLDMFHIRSVYVRGVSHLQLWWVCNQFLQGNRKIDRHNRQQNQRRSSPKDPRYLLLEWCWAQIQERLWYFSPMQYCLWIW